MAKSQIAEMMANETWITAEEAVQTGFANRTADQTVETANESIVQAHWDLSAYENKSDDEHDNDPFVEDEAAKRKRRFDLAKRALRVRSPD